MLRGKSRYRDDPKRSGFKKSVLASDLCCAGQQAFNSRGPFSIEGGALKGAADAVVPVIGVGGIAFFAVQVGVNRHAVGGFEFVNQVMSSGPIAFCIPPEGG